MNEAYHATSAKGYSPLTDEQKETMTDDQVEKWETKIKDSLLRRDDTLGSIISTLRSSLDDKVTLDGKEFTLSSFGIVTGTYTEKGKLHIRGDSEDSDYSGYSNKLMKALEEQPDNVMKVLNELAGDMYTSLTDKMKSTTLRSALTIYNDKDMTKTIKEYKSDLDTLEDKLSKIESRYYKQFSAMESAMSKMNSQSSSLASMLGTNG
jgi:flagellar hook-associated protein 2